MAPRRHPEEQISRRQGGPIPGDGDNMMEPMQIEAHEGEYVVRPEAVDAVGVDALDQLNSMGMRTRAWRRGLACRRVSSTSSPWNRPRAAE